MIGNRSAGGPPAGPPAARWRGSGRAAEPAAVQPARPPALRLAVVPFLAGGVSASDAVPPAWETVPKAALAGEYCAEFHCSERFRLDNIRLADNRVLHSSNASTSKV